MSPPDIVRLGGGEVRGLRLDGHLSFRGIPYAAPPVGERRWRAPAPVVPWSGVRDATTPGPDAPQPTRSFAHVTSTDEDCLTLDVTVPDTPTTGRPVLVWLHGGGGTNGTATRGAGRLATTGDAVVVTPRFRLGVLACFGHPGLADGGTFGLQDQQAALRWVRREITRFGGDPANVTLAGESYGALMVAAHLVAPASAGLFHRAILQSAFAVLAPTPAHTLIPGVPALPPRWTPADELDRLGATTAAEHGWTAPGGDPHAALARLRRVPVTDLIQASDAFIRPAFGGPVLPESPATALPAGRFHRVPVLLGATRDEARFFVAVFADLVGNPVTARDYPRLLAEAFGDAADEVAARYPLARFATPGLAWARVCTDRAWAWPTWQLGRVLAAHTDTWCYEFADPDAPPPVPLPGLPTGPQHAAELAYQFDVPGSPPLSAAQRGFAERVNRYWTAFAAHGDPAHPDLPDWPGLRTGHVQSLAPDRIGGADYAADHRLDFWARLP
ncbi:carboxylesterase/lipase family protein [Saccharothrix longispora]|uniref:carboxylesterase/lipase family protein n=1 Tax=Saccharothrix longispora TaxID=33920 RepID=UPI0028FD284A|nr:carboxylesterase family protein [Saccharothrix longispora]MBY8848093.1 carboxylesterase family protein [Saccharothrix sp. MB29]MDU0289811.1 carboxylesterase family protein [Saccharothrix longispora]